MNKLNEKIQTCPSLFLHGFNYNEGEGRHRFRHHIHYRIKQISCSRQFSFQLYNNLFFFRSEERQMTKMMEDQQMKKQDHSDQQKCFSIDMTSAIAFDGVNSNCLKQCVILNLLRNFIMAGRHYDTRNPSIIMCRDCPLLENIFKMAAIHVSQVVSVLSMSLICEDHEILMDSGVTQIDETSTTSTCNLTRKFKLSAKLWSLFYSAALISTQKLFLFKEAASLLSIYIVSRKEQLFDPRNIFVAIVDQDPLGEVFEVSAFHRSQVFYFLRKHLIPVEKDYLFKLGRPNYDRGNSAMATSVTKKAIVY